MITRAEVNRTIGDAALEILNSLGLVPDEAEGALSEALDVAEEGILADVATEPRALAVAALTCLAMRAEGDWNESEKASYGAKAREVGYRAMIGLLEGQAGEALRGELARALPMHFDGVS